jgi:dTDP-4-amino-4,6-dideoxygalactose transaminase
VHALGISVDVPALSTLGVPIIEDCCQALGAVRAHRRLPIGGAAAIYSFNATKCIATGEGGAVAARDPDLAARVRAVLEHSRVPSAFTDLQAALGISQLSRYEENLERRRRIADHYFEALPPDLTAALRAVRDHSMFYRFPLRLRNLDFTSLQARCARRGVAIRRGVDALLHRARELPDTRFPHASQRFEETVSIPLYPSLTHAEQARVSRAVSEESGLSTR